MNFGLPNSDLAARTPELAQVPATLQCGHTTRIRTMTLLFLKDSSQLHEGRGLQQRGWTKPRQRLLIALCSANHTEHLVGRLDLRLPCVRAYRVPGVKMNACRSLYICIPT